MKKKLTRQIVMLAFLFGSSVGVVVSSEPRITVWKSATCGCCQKWVDYLSDNGFDVVTHDVEDVVPIKQELGLTNPALYSCHTALVDGYVEIPDLPGIGVQLNEETLNSYIYNP